MWWYNHVIFKQPHFAAEFGELKQDAEMWD